MKDPEGRLSVLLTPSSTPKTHPPHCDNQEKRKKEEWREGDRGRKKEREKGIKKKERE